MRLRTALWLLLAGAVLTGCARTQSRELATYYDPRGMFSADLPAANSVSVADPQPTGSRASVLSGVIASPPQPSPTADSGIGGQLGAIAQQAPSDQTQYHVLVVTTDAFASLDEMGVYFLTGGPSLDVREERPIVLAGTEGRLIVADFTEAGSVRAGVAAALTLGSDGVGYIVAAVFAPGAWDGERSDFARVVASLRPDVPTGLSSFPIAA